MRNVASAITLATLVSGCSGARENPYDAPAAATAIFAERAVVSVDEQTKRVLVLVPKADGGLARHVLPLASPLVALRASEGGTRVFIVTAGRDKTRTEPAVTPELIVLAVEGDAVKDVHYTLPVGMGELTIDPKGAYVAITASGARGGLVTNPNALVLVNLAAPPSERNPAFQSVARNSAVTRPLVFSPELGTPRGAKRFLACVGPREVALIDLAAAFDAQPAPPVTVPLTSAGSTSTLVPSLVRFDDGDPASNTDARVAFALTRESSLLTATFAANEAPLAGESTLRTIVNLTSVGAPVSDFAFLDTPEGRRIAALTPSRQKAVLADPATSLTTSVALARAYDGLRVLPGASASTILLTQTGGSTGAVALWDLPKTQDQPYRAVEALADVPMLSAVEAIPGSAARFLATGAGGTQLAVLDVAARTATAVTIEGASKVLLARDGSRAYVVPTGGSVSFATLSLANFTARKFAAGVPVGVVGELRRADGLPLVAVLHGAASTSLSLFDPARPDDLGARWDDLLVNGVR